MGTSFPVFHPSFSSFSFFWQLVFYVFWILCLPLFLHRKKAKVKISYHLCVCTFMVTCNFNVPVVALFPSSFSPACSVTPAAAASLALKNRSNIKYLNIEYTFKKLLNIEKVLIYYPQTFFQTKRQFILIIPRQQILHNNWAVVQELC